MSPSDVLELLRARPFRPFRIHMSDGTQYEIRHQGFAIVTPSQIILGIPGPTVPAGVVERVVHLSVSHVVRLEHIEPWPRSQEEKR